MGGRGRGKRGGGNQASTKASAPPVTQPSGRGKTIAPGELLASNRKTTATTTKRLPGQYYMTPTPQPAAAQESPSQVFGRPSIPGVRDYPPPATLFPNTTGKPTSSSPLSANRRSPSDQARSDSPLSHPSSSQLRPQTQPQPRFSQQQSQPQASPQSHGRMSPPSIPRQSPLNSSQAQNSHEEEDDEDDVGYEPPREPTLSAHMLDVLNEMLTQVDRHKYTTVLSPTNEPDTLW